MRLANIKRHLAPYRFYGRLSTTVSYGVAAAMAPRDPVNDPRWPEALAILGQDAGEELTCVYCGAPATSWDHLFPLVSDKDPTGHGHVVGNLVPACGSCNTRKGNRPWREVVEALPDGRRELVRDRLQQLVDRFIGDEETPFDAHPFPPEVRAELVRLRAEIHDRMREVDALVGAHRIPLRAASPGGADGGGAPRTVDPPGSRRAFYAAVFERLEADGIRPPKLADRGWTQFRNGPFGSFWIWLTRDEMRAVCYLHTTLAGVDKAMFNTELFSMLLAEEDEIEGEVGEDLVWESLDAKQACWIGLTTERPDLSDPVQADAAAEWTAAALRRLIPALEGRARRCAAELRESPVETEPAPETSTVLLSWPEPWACPWDGSTDTTTWIDVFGPEGRAGHVTALMTAAQHTLLPATTEERFFLACTHLVAREARKAYNERELALPAQFEPRNYRIDVDPVAVDERMRGDDLPDLEVDGGRSPVGDVEVAGTYGSWPLTFAGLERTADGEVLTLEIDGEDGPILTFEVSPPTAPAGLDPADRFWRAVAGVASEAIRHRIESGAIAVPEAGCYLSVVVDLEEASRLAQDDEAFERFASEWPVEWPA